MRHEQIIFSISDLKEHNKCESLIYTFSQVKVGKSSSSQNIDVLIRNISLPKPEALSDTTQTIAPSLTPDISRLPSNTAGSSETASNLPSVTDQPNLEVGYVFTI
jgi:hypothetical protein